MKDLKVEIKIDILPTFKKIEGVMKVSDFRTGEHLAFSSSTIDINKAGIGNNLNQVLSNLKTEAEKIISLRADSKDYGT